MFVRKGKSQDFVKFIDLSNMTLEDIKHFEKQLESLNRKQQRYYHIDAPMGVKDYFFYR